ncbi:MAG: hypothetical protein IPF78_00710 [Flavobacteriales bacterium]|nr:hypothetical protein [Flavobacteriales bacterium]
MNASHRLPRRLHFAALALCALGIAGAARAQNNVAINATGAAANNYAILDVSSITQGLFIPRMATLPPNPATLPQGLTVFRTGAANVRGLWAVDYGQWIPLTNGNHGWDIYGNFLTNAADPNVDFIGTSDSPSRPMYFRTNNLPRMRMDATTGYLGVGWPILQPASKERLDINGAIRQYYVPSPGVETSNTNDPGVFRYQTRGNWTGTGNYKYGSNEKLAVNSASGAVISSVLGTVNNYPLQFAGHWGNVDGTAMRQGSSPPVIQPMINGWRAFENPYTEVIDKSWSHFREAVCDNVSRFVNIPSGIAPPYTMSNTVSPGAPNPGDQDLITPFICYNASRPYMRRQYLFLASELNMEIAQLNSNPSADGGFCPGEPIDQIAFWVTRNILKNVLTMSISVRNAPIGLTALNGFDNTPDYAGTMSCGTYVPPWPNGPVGGPSWFGINLAPFFVWDGTSNIIIEVAVRYQTNAGNPINAANNPVGCVNTGFNATYGANSVSPPPTVPAPVPIASCNLSSGSAIMQDNAGPPVPADWKSGPSTWRPVVRFHGKMSTASLAATSGVNNASYIYYPGALVVEDTLTNVSAIPWGRWRANYPAGNSYWAYQGSGTVSAQNGVYDNGLQLNDHVFDRAFDGRVAPGDAAHFGAERLLSIDEMEAFTRDHRHLPTMKGREAWKEKGGFSLGDLTNQLWATTETQALYVADLHDKLNVIEMLTNERPITTAEFRIARQDLGAMADLTDADKARLIADLRKRVTLTSSSR